MTMHLFGDILTAQGIAANNRGENEGTVSTLQKVIRSGEIYTTVSAEAIRYALREVWLEEGENLNRRISANGSTWRDNEFEKWQEYTDDDILGFMHPKKETVSRRAVLEITRAVSVNPWPGDLSFNFASPGANPSVTHRNPIPYAVEIHDTRYQYGFAMTPDSLADQGRVATALKGLMNLRRVAGNHSRYLFDFSPESIVLRWTPDPAPRLLNCFQADEHGDVSCLRLIARVKAGDISPEELVVGGMVAETPDGKALLDLGVAVVPGVKTAANNILARVG